VPKPADKHRDACRQAIRDAIRDHGPDKAAEVVRRAFPDVNPQTLKGWIAGEKRDARALAERVMADVPMPARGPGRPPLDVVPTPMPVTEVKAISDGRRQLERSAATRTRLSFFARFDELEADLARVRTACVKVDPVTGNERIVNPAALLLCVREGRANLKMAMDQSAVAWGIERSQFFAQQVADLFSDAIKELPEREGRAAVARLRALYEARQEQINQVDPADMSMFFDGGDAADASRT
jgi:hypothetical protein